MHRRRACFLSLSYAVVMLLILLAGSDLPPPPGFLSVVVILIGLVGLGTYVIPTWWAIFDRHGTARVVRVAVAEGAGLGLLVAGGFTWLSPGEPSVTRTVTSALIGVGVVTAVGAVVGGLVGAISVAARPKEPAGSTSRVA